MKKTLLFLSLLFAAIVVSACSDETDPNVLKVSKSSDEIVGENYETVITDLKATGFTDIETKVMDDLITGWLTKDGEVEQVQIDGQAEFSAEDSFQKDSKIVITYHTFPEEEKSDKTAADEKSSEKDEEAETETAVEETTDDASKEEAVTDESEEATGDLPDKEASEETVEESQQEILTVENSPELAAVLAVKDEYDPLTIAFAKKYAGKTIEIDANIVNMMHHGSFDTRYDILMFAGDYSETNFSGPNFKFEDVNMMDLNFEGDNVPDTIGMGQNLRITAVIEEFDESMGILFLDPVMTEIR